VDKEAAVSDGEERKRPNANYRLSKTKTNPDEIVYHYDRERRLENAPQAVRDLYTQAEQKRPKFLGMNVGNRFQVIMMVFILVICAMALAATLAGRNKDASKFGGNTLVIQALRLADEETEASSEEALPSADAPFLSEPASPSETASSEEPASLPEMTSPSGTAPLGAESPESMVIVAIDKTVRNTGFLWNRKPAANFYTGQVDVEILPADAAAGKAPFMQRLRFAAVSPQFFRFTVPFDSDELDIVLKAEGLDLSVKVPVK
jgi:hypothetical protein